MKNLPAKMFCGMFAAGVCSGLSLSLPYVSAIVSVLSCALALQVVRGVKTIKEEVFRFSWFVSGFVLGGIHWVGLAIYRPPANDLIDTTALCAVLMGFHALIYVSAFGIVRFSVSWLFPRSRRTMLLPCVAVAWALAELVRGVGPWALPWGALGYSQIENPILRGLYPITGSIGVSGAVWLLAGFFVGASSCVRERFSHRELTKFNPSFGWGVAFVVVGLCAQFVSWTTLSNHALTVRVVHTNWPEEDKYTAENQLSALTLLRDAADVGGTDLIVFPELFLVQRAGLLPQDYRSGVVRATARSGTALMFGEPGLVLFGGGENKANQNTLVLIDSSGKTTTYAKEVLLPFSEYFPTTPVLRWAYPFLYRYPLADLYAGDAKQPMMSLKNVPLGVTICNELAYPGKAARQASNAEVLVNASSDSWVSSKFYLLQAQSLARVRAMEAQKPLIRANNVGPSAFISPDGKVIGSVWISGSADLQVLGRVGNTPFVRMASMLSRF